MLASAAFAEEPAIASEKARFKVEVVAEGLDHPWAIARLPDGRLLVTERPGRLRILENGRLWPEPVAGTPAVYARGQGGLLDVVLHPDYAKNGWIYLAFSDPQGDLGLTKIVRGRLKDNAWTDQETIFEAAPGEYTASNVHFGCRMQFDSAGDLFFTIGDRGDVTKPTNNAQKLTNAKGKVHRVHADGRIPADNPFVKESGAIPSIWSWGHRNPQGLRFAADGSLWEVEHGPRGGDELNIIERGKNYGWPLVTFGINYSGTPISDKTEAPGLQSPVTHWTPSIGIGGMDFYTGDQFAAWKGNLFITALVHQKLLRLELDADRKVAHQEILLEKSGRIRDVRDLGDGFLYLVYDEPGRIVRLVPADS